MTIIDPAVRELCGGAVALPGDHGYDPARRGLNLAVDQRPAAIVFPADAGEIAAVVRFARAAGLRVTRDTTADLSGTVLVKPCGMDGVAI